jgi:acetone carboxylase gamma subunit
MYQRVIGLHCLIMLSNILGQVVFLCENCVRQSARNIREIWPNTESNKSRWREIAFFQRSEFDEKLSKVNPILI